MPIVRVKQKFQVTLPRVVRKQAGLAVGDLLEARIERGKITLVPQSLIDRRIEESLEDFKHGRFSGPFKSTGEAVRSLRRARKKKS
jgi:AbrB family looped-hinge helix DNA binding protein